MHFRVIDDTTLKKIDNLIKNLCMRTEIQKKLQVICTHARLPLSPTTSDVQPEECFHRVLTRFSQKKIIGIRLRRNPYVRIL